MAIIVPILSEFDDKGIKKAINEFKRAKTTLDKTSVAVNYVGDSFQKMGRSLTRNVTVPLVGVAAAGFKAVQMAGSLNEAIGKTEAVFGSSAKDIIAWSKTTTTSLAQTQQQTLDAVATYGNLFKTFGLNEKAAADMSKQLVILATDMSAFNDVPIDQVLIAIRSGLVGVGMPLKDLGVNILDSTLKAKAFEMGLIDTKNAALDPAQKSLAAFNLIMEQTASQQGTAERESKNFNMQMRILQAEAKQGATELGQVLLPAFTSMLTFVREQVIPRFRTFVEILKALGPEVINNVLKFMALIAVLGPLLIVIGGVIKGIMALIRIFVALKIVVFAIPLAILMLIGAFRYAGTEQAALAKETRTFWQLIYEVIKNGVIGIIELVDMVINAWRLFANTLTWVAMKYDNFLKRLAGMDTQVIPPLLEFVRQNTVISELAKDVEKGWDSTFAKFKDGFESLNNVASDFNATQAVLEKEMADLEALMKSMGEETNKTGDKLNKTKERVQALKQAIVQMKQEAVDKLTESLSKAQQELDKARDKFDSFRNSVTDSIKEAVDFKRASETENFLEGLIGQVGQATKFADRVKTLIQMGLSERGIQEVLKAGYEAGADIADQLIAGGQTMIKQVNDLLTTVENIAQQVGEYGANEFYGAGVKQGEALVNGILAALRDAQADLKAAQKAALAGTDIVSYSNLGSRATGLLSDIQGIKNTVKREEALKDFSKALEQSKGAPAISKNELANIKQKYRLAKGGIALGPTPALIGEAGPEMVVPLSGANSAKGLGTTYNITVNAGIGTNGAQVGSQIVDAIKKYERQSGQVFARA